MIWLVQILYFQYLWFLVGLVSWCSH
jgi:hypothetical protein